MLSHGDTTLIIVAALAAYQASVLAALVCLAIVVLRWALAQDHC